MVPQPSHMRADPRARDPRPRARNHATGHELRGMFSPHRALSAPPAPPPTPASHNTTRARPRQRRPRRDKSKATLAPVPHAPRARPSSGRTPERGGPNPTRSPRRLTRIDCTRIDCGVSGVDTSRRRRGATPRRPWPRGWPLGRLSWPSAPPRYASSYASSVPSCTPPRCARWRRRGR